MPTEHIGVFTETTAREILRRTHISASSAPSDGMAGPDGHATRPFPLGETWLGIITAAGPNSEADYTGSQYWVETAGITNALGSNPPNTTLPTIEAQSYPNESTRWITATNLAEVPGATHLLTAGALVLVTEMWGLDDSPYYVFTRVPMASNIVITIDGGGSVITSSLPTLGGATVEVPYDCTIVNWTVESDTSGSIAVDVIRANKNVPSASIVGISGNKPTLTAQQYASAVPSDWTSLALVQGDIVGFTISGTPASVKRVTVTLRVQG